MDQSVVNIKSFFHKAKMQAKPRLKPFVIEMEDISVKRAKNIIDDNQANDKMRKCCMKNGINPIVIDASYFEAQGLKMSSVGNNPLDFNAKKPGIQHGPEFKFKTVGIDFNGKKPNRQGTPKIGLPNFGFKPVNLFRNGPMIKENSNKKNLIELPNFNIKMPEPKHTKHQGRFEMVDLMPGPKGSNEIFIKPIFPGNKTPKNSNKPLKPKRPKINIKPFDFRGLF